MMWPFRGKRKVDKDDLAMLHVQSGQLVERMKRFEQAALDGEEHWMLVKCKPKTKVDHPLRRDGDAVCVI